MNILFEIHYLGSVVMGAHEVFLPWGPEGSQSAPAQTANHSSETLQLSNFTTKQYNCISLITISLKKLVNFGSRTKDSCEVTDIEVLQ